jgi:hypothetical protein
MLILSKSNFKISLNSHVWFPLLAIILRLIPATADFSYLILAVYSLLGRQQIIEALLLSWVFTVLNSSLVPVVEYASFTRYIIILACFTSIFFRLNFRKIEKITLVTFGLGIFFIIHSIFFSKIPEVSILKGLNWIVVIMTLLLAWQNMDSLEHKDTEKQITRILSIIVLFSMLVFLFLDTGFNVNTRYFQGVLNHPQAFGMTAAALSAIFIGQLFDQNRSTLFLVIMIILCISLTIISGSRTAGTALLLAVIISSLIFMTPIIKKIKSLSYISRDKSFFLLGFFILIILSFNNVYDVMSGFITKTNEVSVGSIINAYKISRGVLYIPMIDNILESPLKGIGFGLASDLTNMDIKYFKGIPVSAPIEKGILPLAILEEVGVFGFIFFMIWILILIRLAINNSFRTLIVLLTILLFNLGEAGLFSANGYGMLYLIVITSIITRPKLIKN